MFVNGTLRIYHEPLTSDRKYSKFCGRRNIVRVGLGGLSEDVQRRTNDASGIINITLVLVPNDLEVRCRSSPTYKVLRYVS